MINGSWWSSTNDDNDAITWGCGVQELALGFSILRGNVQKVHYAPKSFFVNNDSLLNVQCVYFMHHHDYFHTLIKGDSKQLQKFKIEDQIKDF